MFVAAALQVHFARLAAQLDANALVPVGEGACPACGGPPIPNANAPETNLPDWTSDTSLIGWLDSLAR